MATEDVGIVAEAEGIEDEDIADAGRLRVGTVIVDGHIIGGAAAASWSDRRGSARSRRFEGGRPYAPLRRYA